MASGIPVLLGHLPTLVHSGEVKEARGCYGDATLLHYELYLRSLRIDEKAALAVLLLQK